ncbi:hypothetical protein Bca4012_019996 [Brassica carinata]
MDSQTPYGQYFRYESFPANVNIGASEIPPFSSQHSEAPSQPAETPVERTVRRKWTPTDDEVLISGWLNISKDSIVGNEQKSGNFWKCVDEYFAEAMNENVEVVHCKQRWHKINGDTNKFCAAYAAAERQASSGQNDNDVLMDAHKIYFSDHGSKFTLDHAWCLLRYEQKWVNLNTPKTGSSKRKTGDAWSQSSNTHVGDQETRPEGVKAAKSRRSTGQGKALEDYRSMYELRMVDLDKKEKLSKLEILDTLLAKKDPLSESEETVKNKLLAECF